MSELLAQIRDGLVAGHHSRRTEKAHCHWVRRYVRFCGLQRADLADSWAGSSCPAP